MKHCPNPQCHGLEKFGFVSEYEDSATACGDCGGALLDGPAPTQDAGEAPDPDMELVPLIKISDTTLVMLLESQLEASGIPYLAKGEHLQDLFGFGRLVQVNPISGPVEFLVREDDLEAARTVVAGIET